MEKRSKIIPLRWNEENLQLFDALGYIDQRNGKIRKKSKDIMSFNKFINNVVSEAFKTLKLGGNYDYDKLKKRLKLITIQSLSDDRDKIEEEMLRISKI